MTFWKKIMAIDILGQNNAIVPKIKWFNKFWRILLSRKSSMQFDSLPLDVVLNTVSFGFVIYRRRTVSRHKCTRRSFTNNEN